jgi:hypothetical protein
MTPREPTDALGHLPDVRRRGNGEARFSFCSCMATLPRTGE